MVNLFNWSCGYLTFHRWFFFFFFLKCCVRCVSFVIGVECLPDVIHLEFCVTLIRQTVFDWKLGTLSLDDSMVGCRLCVGYMKQNDCWSYCS